MLRNHSTGCLRTLPPCFFLFLVYARQKRAPRSSRYAFVRSPEGILFVLGAAQRQKTPTTKKEVHVRHASTGVQCSPRGSAARGVGHAFFLLRVDGVDDAAPGA